MATYGTDARVSDIVCRCCRVRYGSVERSVGVLVESFTTILRKLAAEDFASEKLLRYWGEPERAPHVRVVQRARLYILILRSGYWSGNRTLIPVAIGPAIGHVQGKRQSDSCIYFVRLYTSCMNVSF